MVDIDDDMILNISNIEQQESLEHIFLNNEINSNTN